MSVSRDIVEDGGEAGGGRGGGGEGVGKRG